MTAEHTPIPRSNIGRICYYREAFIRAIIMIVAEETKGKVVERKLRILSSAKRKDGNHLPVGTEFTASWPIGETYNQICLIEFLPVKNVRAAIQHVDNYGWHTWTR